MFKKKSPVKKKFTAPTVTKRRRQLDPRTVVILKQVGIGLALMAIIAVILTTVWYVTRLSVFTVATVSVEGGETIDTALLEEKIQTTLNGDYIGFIPRRFVYAYPEAEIFKILEETPRLKSPTLTRDGTTLNVRFEEYYPHALWCEGRDSEYCFFIDKDGFAFSEAPKLEGGAFPRFHVIGGKPAVKTQMVPVEDLRAIEALREALYNELQFPVAFVETDIVRDVFLGLAGGGEIKATLRMSPEETVANLRSILASKEFSDLKPGSFQYVDLRFGNKVFVNEEDPNLVKASSTATTSPFTPVEAALMSTTELDAEAEAEATSTLEIADTEVRGPATTTLSDE